MNIEANVMRSLNMETSFRSNADDPTYINFNAGDAEADPNFQSL
jgi:hypothetical protein